MSLTNDDVPGDSLAAESLSGTVPDFNQEPLFDDAEDDVGSNKDLIHIRVQQRNGRKSLTTLQGLPKQYDSKKLLKAFKKEFACNGTLVEDEEMGKVIQLQGDQRAKMYNFLTEEGLPQAMIKVHGF